MKKRLLMFVLLIFSIPNLISKQLVINFEGELLELKYNNFSISKVIDSRNKKDSIGVARVGFFNKKTNIVTKSNLDVLLKKIISNSERDLINPDSILLQINKFNIHENNSEESIIELNFSFYVLSDSLLKVYEYDRKQMKKGLIDVTRLHKKNAIELITKSFQNFANSDWKNRQPLYKTENPILDYLPEYNYCFVCYPEIEKVGLDYYSNITEMESILLNQIFNHKNLFFKGAKVGFLNSIDYCIGKNHFFKSLNYPINIDENPISFFELTNEEKENSKYDFIVIKNSNGQLSSSVRDKIIQLLEERDSKIPKYVDQIGLNDQPYLNEFEITFINSSLSYLTEQYNLENKKIGFFTGSGGNVISSKMDYFNNAKERLSHNYDASYDYLLILSNEEKIKSGGFDAIIVSWCKMIPTVNDKMLKKLKENGT